MTRFAVAVALAATVGTVAHAGYGYDKKLEPTPEPKCYESLEKCAGASGYAYHKYMPCCDPNDDCVENPEYGWGKFCMPKGYKPADSYKPVTPAPEKCYENGVKCMGAAGYPAYQYKPCCDEKAKCVADSKLGWGKFCKVPSPAPKDPYVKPEYPEVEPEKKCYSNGVKCMGAPGYPFYQYKPCCDSSAKCVENPKLGWGKFCMTDKYVAPEKPDYYEPVDPTPAKCYENGIKCMGAAGYPSYQYKPCCDPEAKCVTNAELGWGKFCMKPEMKYPEYEKPEPKYPEYEKPEPKYPEEDKYKKPSPSPSPEMKYPEYEKPEPKYPEEDKYKKPSPSPEPKYTKPTKCYENGVKCMGAAGYPAYPYKPCCDPSARCVTNPKLGWGKFCMAPEYPDVVEVGYPGKKDKPVIVVKDDYKPEYKCLKAGETCKAGSECCSGDCKKGSWYGAPSKCVGEPKKSPSPSPSASPEAKCYTSFTEECKDDAPCCTKEHKCVNVVSFGGKRCVPDPVVTTAAPTTAAPTTAAPTTAAPTTAAPTTAAPTTAAPTTAAPTTAAPTTAAPTTAAPTTAAPTTTAPAEPSPSPSPVATPVP